MLATASAFLAAAALLWVLGCDVGVREVHGERGGAAPALFLAVGAPRGLAVAVVAVVVIAVVVTIVGAAVAVVVHCGCCPCG